MSLYPDDDPQNIDLASSYSKLDAGLKQLEFLNYLESNMKKSNKRLDKILVALQQEKFNAQLRILTSIKSLNHGDS